MRRWVNCFRPYLNELIDSGAPTMHQHGRIVSKQLDLDLYQISDFGSVWVEGVDLLWVQGVRC